MTPPLSQQCNELFYGNSRAAEDRTQGAAIQFFVVRDYDLGKWLVAAKYHVTPFLPAQLKARLPQRSCAFPARDTRQLAHTATSSVSNCSSGTGR